MDIPAHPFIKLFQVTGSDRTFQNGTPEYFLYNLLHT